ncbi:uncharacterized protein C8R40DRAFT_1198385 [Lentinula edodes]|uniref:uncharacterized protein n=1 Tax=Lentinula edodes TaxID=5353 RepID=UPI001E8CA198|nr:uncharacterized protein C8R40DRAFT_1198385 [Lentinula edodes]KAH7873088.1 hypothetical protein C8R40DRAFT_1198385 [Lentinula edodes]
MLDPVLTHPEYIDHKIEFPLPDVKTDTSSIFRLYTSHVSLAEDVDLEDFCVIRDGFSAGHKKAVHTETGLLALKERRIRVIIADFSSAREEVLHRNNEDTAEGLYL